MTFEIIVESNGLRWNEIHFACDIEAAIAMVIENNPGFTRANCKRYRIVK